MKTFALLLALCAPAIFAIMFGKPYGTGSFILSPMILWGYWISFRCSRDTSEELPNCGPPAWPRRYLFYFWERLQRDRIINLLVLALSIGFAYILVAMDPRLGMGKIDLFDDIGVDFLSFLASILLCFLMASYRMRRWKMLHTVLVIEWAFAMLTDLANATVIKGIGLSIVCVVLEARHSRGLEPKTLRGIVDELACIPWKLAETSETPLGRLIRIRRVSWLILVVVSAAMITIMEALNAREMGLALVWLAAAGATVGLSYLWSAASTLASLKNREVLSELLLTEITREQIVSMIVLRTLGTAIAQLFSVLMAATIYNYTFCEGALFDHPVHAYFFWMLALVIITIQTVLLGPLLNRSLRGATPFLTIARAFAEVFGFCLACGAVILFLSLLRNTGYNSRGNPLDMDGLYVGSGFFVLILAWSYARWQYLLRDFDAVAHGTEENSRLVASKEEVGRFRRLLRLRANQSESAAGT